MPPLARALVDWYDTFPARGPAALDALGELFAEDVRFHDPFRDTVGLEPLRELFARMFRRYPSVRFAGWEVVGDDERFSMTYEMRMRMAIGPEFVTPMASRVTARDGKVAVLVDHYDFATGLVSPVPFVAAAYRGAVRGLFL